MHNHKKAFGLIGLLITLAIIALASGAMFSSFSKPNNGGETPMEQGLSAINEAEKAKQLLEQRGDTYSNTGVQSNTLPWGEGKHAIDNIALPGGEDVLFITDALPQGGMAIKDQNCTIPEIQTVNAFLRYRDIEIPLGKIGIPKTIENTWPPMTVNPVDTGLINENISFTWAPLYRFGVNIIGVVDYASIKEVVQPAVSRDTIGAKDGNFDIDKACFLNYKIKFFKLSPDFKTIEPNAHYSEGVFENIFQLRVPIEPGRTYQNNCTPLFGCG
ncbi:MAG: hypothetical protein Q7S11_00240 [bacterium]|nr:hypothetical protein [bacterium]